MSFDISSLGITAEPADIQPDEYVAPAGSFDEPVAGGTYDAKLAVGKIKDRDSGTNMNIRPGAVTHRKTGKTYLGVEFAVQIAQDGVFKDRVVYGRANTIPEGEVFERVKPGRETANGLLDLLMASGAAPASASSEAYVDALDRAVEAEATVRAQVDWSAYCNPKSNEYPGCGLSIRGMKNFPPLPTGGFDPRITCPGVHGTDAPVLLARAEVKRVYAAKR